MDDGDGDAAHTAQQSRKNGRQALQLRSLTCERGVLVRADGSARWSQGESAVLAAVYGPRQTLSHREDAEQATISVAYKPRSGLAGARERLHEQVLRQAAEGAVLAGLHPRALISITVQELLDGGGLLACALNAVNAALIDAGIPLRHTFVAATCCIDSEAAAIVDPDAQEEQEARAVATNCFSARLAAPGDAADSVAHGLLACDVVGRLTPAQLAQLKQLSRRCCQRLAAFARTSTAKSFA